MLTEPTIDKLSEMRLAAMAAAWTEQQKNAEVSKLSFDERFGMLVDAEWTTRENKRLKRGLQQAKLKISQACLESIDYSARRELDKAQMRQLAGCKWIDEHQNIVITGATGVGKTYLACALAQQACRKGYKTLYWRATRLFDELSVARAEGNHLRMLARIAKVSVLVIDDWALSPLREHDRQELLEVLDDRYSAGSTIVASQLPPERWHTYLAEPTIADAICDRLLHNAHRLTLKGPSRRKEAKPD